MKCPSRRIYAYLVSYIMVETRLEWQSYMCLLWYFLDAQNVYLLKVTRDTMRKCWYFFAMEQRSTLNKGIISCDCTRKRTLWRHSYPEGEASRRCERISNTPSHYLIFLIFPLRPEFFFSLSLSSKSSFSCFYMRIFSLFLPSKSSLSCFICFFSLPSKSSLSWFLYASLFAS